ncbi:unnamed protein product [Symbiodinium sp. CCMP2592]|nr:unnamed protein product [Symbiodinium sp. CCMP2592]
MSSLDRLGLAVVALTGVSSPALGEEPVLYGGFITARKATDRQVRFWKKLTAEGIPLVATRVRDSAYQRIRGHAVVVKQCESVEADLCLIIEDFVDWRSGSLARSIQEVVNTVPDFDVAILGRNDQEFRCADLEPALGSFARVRCSPIANYAYVVHRRYFQAMFEALNSPGEICGYHTDIYFGTEQMYAVDPSSRWYVKSPLPVRVRWQRAPSPGDFASRCALGALSSRPVVLLHPMRAGGTSLCDLAAQWIDVGRRGGVDNCRIDSLQAFRDAAGAWPFVPDHELNSGQARRLFARGLGFISVEPSFSDWDDGSGHEDGTDTNRSARMARWLGSMTGLRSGFWSSYLHVLMVHPGRTRPEKRNVLDNSSVQRVRVICGVRLCLFMRSLVFAPVPSLFRALQLRDLSVFGEPYSCRRNPLDRYLSWLQFCIPVCSLMEKVDMDQAESYRDFVARCFKEKVSEFVELVLEPGLTRSSFSIRSPFLFQDDRRQFVPGCRRATLGYHVAQASNCLGRHLV